MRTCLCVLALAIALLAASLSPARGQSPEELARNPGLFKTMVAKAGGWEEPAEPLKILGPIYFVGTRGLGIWLITTSQGHILINSGMASGGPMVEASIRKLGFRPEDIKILLTNHAHFDHVGGHAYLKTLSHAQVAMMAEDVEDMQTGGKANFFYGKDVDAMGFDPVTVDRVLRDGDAIKLGDVALSAVLTAGHTKGTTTFVANVVDGGRIYTVVFPDGTGVNPGYSVAKDPSYPGIGDDYRRTLHTLEMLKPDVWLAPHLERFDFVGKRARAATEGAAAWVDPEGYRRWVAGERAKFEAQVNKELGVPARP